MKIWGCLNAKTTSVIVCCCSSELLPALEQKPHKPKSRLRKKAMYRPRPFSCTADATQNPMQFLREVEQTSGPEQLMVLMCFRSGDKWRFCCFSLCLVWTLIPEEHKYLLLIYQSEVTRDINADPKDLYFSWSSVLCQFSQPWIVAFFILIVILIFLAKCGIIYIYVYFIRWII